jgi:hypothetical protein
MPLIHYLCKCKKAQSKFYRIGKDAPSGLDCACGETMKKQLSSPSSTSVLTVDNGHQSKSVEVNLEVIKSNEENSVRDFREKE